LPHPAFDRLIHQQRAGHDFVGAWLYDEYGKKSIKSSERICRLTKVKQSRPLLDTESNLL
jgi:hypothetical protein